MYYRELETKAGAKAEHNRRMRANASDRLKANAKWVKAHKKAGE